MTLNPKEKAPIDPRTTRRRVACEEWFQNSAHYATYQIIGRDTNVNCFILEKKPEFCKRKGEGG